MSAKIYALPKILRTEVPNIWEIEDNVDYQGLEDTFINKVSLFCKKYNTKEDQTYIGETISFQVADGYAVYTIANLKPLELIHLPLMDEYESPNIDLMTRKRVKEIVDNQKSRKLFFSKINRVPTDKEIDRVILLIGTDTSDMSKKQFEKLHNAKHTWETKTQHVKWKGINYLIPTYSGNDNYEHYIYKHLCNKCKVN